MVMTLEHRAIRWLRAWCPGDQSLDLCQCTVHRLGRVPGGEVWHLGVVHLQGVSEKGIGHEYGTSIQRAVQLSQILQDKLLAVVRLHGSSKTVSEADTAAPVPAQTATFAAYFFSRALIRTFPRASTQSIEILDWNLKVGAEVGYLSSTWIAMDQRRNSPPPCARNTSSLLMHFGVHTTAATVAVKMR